MHHHFVSFYFDLIPTQNYYLSLYRDLIFLLHFGTHLSKTGE